MSRILRRDLVLHPGGLFRCCVESAAQWVCDEPDEPVTDGTLIRCQWCSKGEPETMVIAGRIIKATILGMSNKAP